MSTLGILPEEAHQQRSRLINDYKSQLRAIEKELKKKKLTQSQRDALEAKLEELERTHEETLKNFDLTYNTSKKNLAAASKQPAAQKQDHADDSDHDHIESRNWSSLSHRDLEEECQQRGLPKKGTKEELVSRLTIDTLERARKHAQKKESSSTGRAKPESTTVAGGGTVAGRKRTDVTIDVPPVVPSSLGPPGSHKDQYKNKRKKLWKRRGAPQGPKETKDSSSDSSDSDSGSASASSDSESSKPKGATNKKGTTKSGTGKGSKHEKSPNADTAAADEEEERSKQLKREAIIASVLSSILKKHAKGISIESIPDLLEKNKVKNFSPGLLGYDSLDEWISEQPKSLLHFDRKKNLIFPPRVGQLPSSSSSESESDEAESDKEEKNESSSSGSSSSSSSSPAASSSEDHRARPHQSQQHNQQRRRGGGNNRRK